MTTNTENQKKLRIGWFTFSCCEDSTVLFTELLNDHWKEWKHLLDFRHARVLQKHNVMDEMDVAFVEGAVTNQEHIDKLKEIRKLAKMVVAIGACAVVGMPSAQRNTFDADKLQEIAPHIARFEHLEKVMTLKEVVAVDMDVPGCPMDTDTFLEVVNTALKKFGINS